MRTRLNMFMLGRNGVDFLNKHLFRIAAIIAGLNLLFLGRIGSVPFLIAHAEDLIAREKCDRAKEKLSGALHRAKQSRDFRFFSCPGCSSYQRVPRGKGRIQVTCPRCGHRFDRKS